MTTSAQPTRAKALRKARIDVAEQDYRAAASHRMRLADVDAWDLDALALDCAADGVRHPDAIGPECVTITQRVLGHSRAGAGK